MRWNISLAYRSKLDHPENVWCNFQNWGSAISSIAPPTGYAPAVLTVKNKNINIYLWEMRASYSSDVDDKQFYEQILDCKMLLALRRATQINRVLRISCILVTVEYGDESVFPNLRIALQIILTMAVYIACWEKLILSYLRVSMGVGRIFSRRGHWGIFPIIFSWGTKEAKYFFFSLENKKTTFFAKIFKIQGFLFPLPPLATPIPPRLNEVKVEKGRNREN